MSLCLSARVDAISRRVTGRQQPLFAEDCLTHRARITDLARGRRILVTGGAGSIGAATIMELLAYRPAALCVLDPSENNLAELVRTVRSGEESEVALTVEPLAYG